MTNRLTAYLVLGLLFLGNTVYATQVANKTLPELVADSDHVVIGTVKAVKMHTWLGFETTNPKSRTGPGGTNELRWTVTIAPSDILYTIKKTVPKEIIIRQWQRWHMDLEGSKHHEGKTYIFLLKGGDMHYVYPAWYYRDLSDRPEIEELLKSKTKQPATQ
ncbi:MAG: hypothetical protein K0R17_345 [Rariglobus sp.]|jgi:hypothetical protein|nr:hypothetical protein [Rariglobus sp.]